MAMNYPHVRAIQLPHPQGAGGDQSLNIVAQEPSEGIRTARGRKSNLGRRSRRECNDERPPR